MTYYQLLDALNKLAHEQLSCDVTVELNIQDEIYKGELRICGDGHDVLDEDHPVIFVKDA